MCMILCVCAHQCVRVCAHQCVCLCAHQCVCVCGVYLVRVEKTLQRQGQTGQDRRRGQPEGPRTAESSHQSDLGLGEGIRVIEK